MPFDRRNNSSRLHAAAIVGDSDQRLPPSYNTTSIRVAPASIAFSTNSLTAAAGRSMTSPAAIRLTDNGRQLADRHRRSLRHHSTATRGIGLSS